MFVEFRTCHDIPYHIIICRIRNIERTLLRKGSMLPEEVYFILNLLWRYKSLENTEASKIRRRE